MPARDPLELRKHAPTVPEDLNDPPRFSQMIETTQDAFVLELRRYFDTKGFTTGDRQEVPTIEKYAVGFGTGLDPYQTFLKIVADFPDVLERLPHVAVTTVSGQNKRFTAGRPFVAHTQAPPRVVTANAGPYALDNPVPQIVEVSIATLPAAPGELYTIVIDGVPTTMAFDPVATRAEIAAGLATAVRQSPAGLLYVVTSTTGAAAVVRIQRRELGTAFAVNTTPNLSALTTQAAGNASSNAMLVFQTRPAGRATPIVSVIQFPPSRFRGAPTEPMSAVPTDALARVFNEQALYAYARVVPVGAGQGLQLETGGKLGGETPNEIEILPSSTPGLVAALGLATAGAAALGDTIGGIAPDMTLNVAAAPFAGVNVGEYVTVAGAVTPANNGKFLVTARTAGQLVFTNPLGVTEGFSGTYFVGRRDDSTNPARPVMNRYSCTAQLNVTIDVLAESPNERREVTDLVFALFLFELELKFFTFYGRGVFDEAYPDEHYQITTHQEIQEPGEQEFPRGQDQKNKIHAMRVVVPVTTTWYIDRTVTVPFGPSQGQSWTLEGRNVRQDDTLPSAS